MTTLINPDGRLGLQIGPPDLLATATLVTSMWNHFGGLKNLVRIFQYIPGLSSLTRVNDLGFKPQDLPATCHILTTHGIRHLNDSDPKNCFGGDARTQLVGFTICALSHLFGQEFGVRMFMKFMASAILEETVDPGVKDLLYAQLTDNAHHIIREGVARSLPSRFEEAIRDTCLPTLACTESRSLGTDDQYIGGLLRWIVQRRRSHYLTRSADVVRVAACLKSVGWLIGPIRISSNDSPPGAYDGLTLLTTGYHETDRLAFDDGDGPISEGDVNHIHHYRNETVGSMLFLALGAPDELSPEKIQDDFYRINSKIRKKLSFTWVVERHDQDGHGPTLSALPQWTKKASGKKTTGSRVSVALACRFFDSKTADNVAECFDGFASDDINQKIRRFEEANDDEAVEPECVQRWKIIVVCIILSIAEILGGDDYSSLAHATQLDLYRAHDYEGNTALQLLSGLLRDFEKGLHFGAVLRLLATCHVGTPLTNIDPSHNVWSTRTIGYQGNGYTVLPNLLFNMSVDRSSIGFRCTNLVFDNLPSHDINGYVETVSSDDWSSYATGEENKGKQAVIARHSSLVSEPQWEAPDVPLYLGLERGRLDYAPMQKEVAFAGRIHGELIGVSGIYDMIVTLVNSFNKTRTCTGHHEPAKALVIKASTWMGKRRQRPMDGTNQYHTYIPVRGSQPWALFLAGQIMNIDGRLCFDCYDCTLEADGRHPGTSGFDLNSEDEYPRVVVGF